MNEKETYICNICNYKGRKLSDLNRHYLTLKHKNKSLCHNYNHMTNSSKLFQCKKCNRRYTARNSLWYHEQKCDDNMLMRTTAIDELIYQNSELQKSLMKIAEKQPQVVHNITSSNKTFNLNFFLNDTCKNAMNISEFINSIKPSLTALEKTGRVGYVEGISDIIVDNLKNIDTHERPIHCSDNKREVLYIKDNNIWEKNQDNYPKLTHAIKTIAHANIKNICEWQKMNPSFAHPESDENTIYLQIVSNAMPGSTTEETDKNINKIISNVAKEVCINKSI